MLTKIINSNSSLFFLILGALIGYFSWGSQSTTSTTLSLSLFWLYLNLNHRNQIFFLFIGYYLSASRGLLLGTINYYNLAAALLIWSVAAIISTLVWCIFWSKEKTKRIFLMSLVLIILILPPIGFINWVNPLIVAGELFSGWRWWGFIFLLILIYGVDYIFSRRVIFGRMVVVCTILFIGFYFRELPAHSTCMLSPINTDFGETEKYEGVEKYQLNNKLIKKCNTSNGKYKLLPENILPYFNEADLMIWQDKLKSDNQVLLGTHVKNEQHKFMYDNVLMKIDSNGSSIFYTQRVPVPLSMWKPWNKSGAVAALFGNPTVQLDKKKVGVFICYEQLIAIVYIHTLIYNPHVIFGSSNLWWAKNTSIKNIQFQTMKLWAKLFSVPFEISVNL